MKIQRIEHTFEAKMAGVIYLKFQYWDDFGYCTEFNVYYRKHLEEDLEKVGLVKIGCKNLESKVHSSKSKNDFNSYSIETLIPTTIFKHLQKDFFSLGQDISYYKRVNEIFGDEKIDYYEAFNDLGYNYDYFNKLYNEREPILINSLMRYLYSANIKQFNRISKGNSELTEYSFSFKYNNQQIDINVDPTVVPPSNMHVLIGRNGVGKTWLLYNMLINLLNNENDSDVEFKKSQKYEESEEFLIEAPKNSFAGIVGVSFSVFDDALAIDVEVPNKTEQEDIKYKKTLEDFNKIYKYIGLISKNQKDGKVKVKSVENLADEFIQILKKIKEIKSKVKTYLETCKNLNNDDMFKDNGFISMLEKFFNNEEYEFINNKTGEKYLEIVNDRIVKKHFRRLSSGHMIIILSLTALVDSVHEKTIVLIDEPEMHLHPPLLSIYIRTLSFLLLKKNAIAIIATHSPIVIQEVPRLCVNKIERSFGVMQFNKVDLETFATNTDSLTREVFGLEVIKTGFYKILEQELEENFDKTMSKFNGGVGSLGQILIQSLLNQKRVNNEED